ncbi:MAG TPA: Rho termination factor N-terminal domain-containing protein, partial [Petrotogaceae bacterium]|nr:Rho termination factor N-terminal domain-containing protein [Petrotogaceae bacterium]
MELDKNLIQMLKNEEPTIQDLRNIAKSLGLKLRRSMKKRDIVKEIRSALSQENYYTVTSDHLQNNKRADVSSGRLSRILTKKSNDSTELCETYNNDRL